MNRKFLGRFRLIDGLFWGNNGLTVSEILSDKHLALGAWQLVFKNRSLWFIRFAPAFINKYGIYMQPREFNVVAPIKSVVKCLYCRVRCFSGPL
jgi:hypothetical protein